MNRHKNIFSDLIWIGGKGFKRTITYKISVSERIPGKTVKTEKIIEIIPDPDVQLLFRNLNDKRTDISCEVINQIPVSAVLKRRSLPRQSDGCISQRV